MKKILVASTALVAAGLLTTGTAAASEKIKLNLGGFSKWWVVGAWNDDKYGTAGNGTANDYANVDVKGDNEIYFGGSTTLDNGMKVGIQVEMEAGGHTDQTSDPIDESYVWIEGGFGKFIVGSENNGTYLLHVMAPDAAGNWGEGGVMTGGWAIARPTAVITPGSTGNLLTTASRPDNDADKITYVAPSFYGLTVGATYIPNAASEDDATPATANEAYGVGALYANTFGGVGVKVSAGYVTYDAAVTTADTQEWTVGTQLSYAGFTVGGSYKDVQMNLAGNGGAGGNGASAANSTIDTTGSIWDAGIQYASGPYAVSFTYVQAETNGTIATAGEDTVTAYQVSGKYNLGAGVDVLASVGHIEYDDETNVTSGVNSVENEGWTVMTGLSLAF